MAASYPKRIVIYPKDIENITGRKPRTCQAMLEKIRKRYNKKKEQPVTVFEFCDYMNISENIVRNFID